MVESTVNHCHYEIDTTIIHLEKSKGYVWFVSAYVYFVELAIVANRRFNRELVFIEFCN